MNAKTYSTQISWSDTNVDKLNIKSPKTGNWITIFQGWIPEISKETAEKIFGKWSEYVKLAYDSNKENTLHVHGWMHHNHCMVELTVAELTELHNIYQKQQAMLNRRNRSRR